MGRSEKSVTFAVQDQRGNRHKVTQTTIFQSGRLLDGGAAPVDERFVLDGGTHLTPGLEGAAFFDPSSGRTFTKVTG
jgi:hypothetical protein